MSNNKYNDGEIEYANDVIENTSLSGIEQLEILQDEGLELEDMIDLLI